MNKNEKITWIEHPTRGDVWFGNIGDKRIVYSKDVGINEIYATVTLDMIDENDNAIIQSEFSKDFTSFPKAKKWCEKIYEKFSNQVLTYEVQQKILKK